MISGLNSSTDRFLNDLAATSRRVERAQQQVTSGKRIAVASDDPDQISRLVEDRSLFAATEQVKSGLSRVKTEVDSSEAALASAVKLLDRARVIAAQGATSTATPEMRRAMADELGNILEELVATSNTTVGGRFVFSGDNDQTPAYGIDLTQATPVTPFNGAASTRRVMDASGGTFATARTAQEIFDSTNPSESVFGSVNELRLALMADDVPAIEAAAGDVGSAGLFLNARQAYYGAVQNRVNAAIDNASSTEVRLKSEIGAIEDADMVQAATELAEATFQRNAALAARGRVPRNSLFDFLA